MPTSFGRPHRTLCFAALATVFALSSAAAPVQEDAPRPPNFIVVFVDDMGYGDIGPFGSERNRTPALDRMAREGMKLTSFYAAPVCTPSRAALMTGCYPRRVGLDRGSWHAVLMPGDTHGIHEDELTIAEVLRERGYVTGCIGKWHLGDQPRFLPTRHGFDEFYGLPYSNDMIPETLPELRDFPPLPLLRDEEVLGAVTDQSALTADYTREALRFVEAHADEPFFLYLAHTMVHVPLHAGERFRGRSGKGLLTDCVEELDWSTGEILAKLRELGIDEHTLVLFTSDNGPARGSAGPLRGRKGSTFEGGVRVPCVVRWPGTVPAGSECDEITSVMDLLPTFAALAGAELPADRRIDGGSIAPLLRGEPGAESPHESLLYYRSNALRAVRSGPWKLHVAGPGIDDPELYDLGRDLGESTDVASEHPEIAARLSDLVEAARAELGDGEIEGAGCRPCGEQADSECLIARPDGSRDPVLPRPPDDLDFRALLEPIPGRVERIEGEIRIDSPAVLRDATHHVWGASVVRGEDGRYHMFYVRIEAGPEARRFGDEWLFSSEIAHAVSDRSDRDFVFDRVLLRGRAADGEPDAWDAQSVHNPHVQQFGDGVYLYHIGSRDPGPQPPGSPGERVRARDRIQQVQQTGVVRASSVTDLAAGRFERPGEPLLGPRTRVKSTDVVDPSPPGTRALPDNLIVVNPSVVRRPSDGAYLLYFKGNLYDPRWRGVHGVAIGESPRGPFRPLDRFVFDVQMPDGRIASAEDPYVWFDRGRRRFYAIVKDFSGRLTGADPGLALLTSNDGLDWRPAKHPLASAKELRFADGTVLPVRNLERPQLLLDGDGRPLVLYAACIVGEGYDGPAFNVHVPLRSDR